MYSIKVFTSRLDGGKNWEKKNKGLGDNLFEWQIRQNSIGRLFLLSPRGQRNGQVVDGAIYFSDNNAETWSMLMLPQGVNGPHDLLLDPVNPSIMYVSCWPRRKSGQDVGGGVIKTEDGGLTWKQVFDAGIRVNSAGMDPGSPTKYSSILFTMRPIVVKITVNPGRELQVTTLNGGSAPSPDINNPGMIYLTTYGGSVFYGPVDGVADEDIENMPAGWW